ncbi:MAG TPA: hypothetical protein VKU40_15815 [Thermoanaerobaculia bacterium]|nr:hypothetical protein [Thermoanaerobaculia bacterium]
MSAMDGRSDVKRHMLRHFLAALAYRTQKALRGAPQSFPDFAPGNLARTPHELVLHMDSVLGYAATFFDGEPDAYRPTRADDFAEQVRGFHDRLEKLSALLATGRAFRGITAEQMLQGPFADAMTHAGQLAMLRRLAGSPVASENFIFAEVDPENLGPEQAEPARPDEWWTGELE